MFGSDAGIGSGSSDVSPPSLDGSISSLMVLLFFFPPLRLLSGMAEQFLVGWHYLVENMHKGREVDDFNV